MGKDTPMTPRELANFEREQEVAAKRAAGLVRIPGAWVTREQYDKFHAEISSELSGMKLLEIIEKLERDEN